MRDNNRIFIRDEVIEVDFISTYDLERKIKDRRNEIQSEVAATRKSMCYISANVEMVDDEPKLVLSIYESDGGF